MNEIINPSFKIILKGKVNWIRGRELDAWVPKFLNEEYSSDEESSESEDGCKFEGQKHYNQNDDDDVDKLFPNNTNENRPQTKDPFNIYSAYAKEEINYSLSKEIQMNFMSLNIQGLGHKAKKGWINRLCSLHKLNFIALQETKMESIDVISIKSVWGNYSFDHAVSSSVRNSGSILCILDPYMLIKDHVSASDNFLAIMGTWVPSSTKLLVISVYAPQELSKKENYGVT
ncbi:RNA-directed DNA polymerase, eukaryota [Tanacetum coccineum]